VDGARDDCSLFFVGTATMLLRFGAFTVLTDPNFLHRGQHAYLGYGLTSRRRTEPAIGIDDLPRLDAIVLSHMHGDHWDRMAKKGLDHDLPVLTTPKAARALGRQGFSAARGLQTWQQTELSSFGERLTITAMPGRHANGIARHLLPPVMGSVVEWYRAGSAEPAMRVYITGDTLLIDDLREIPSRYPGMDAAVLHLGGTRLPGGLLVTMDARQGADLVELLGAGTHVPIHNDDYGVFKSPLAAYRAEAERRGIDERITYVARGETIALRPNRSGAD
jgi:L-ascorbate metabolism protein UlaG (beta-lactamase superfamily)